MTGDATGPLASSPRLRMPPRHHHAVLAATLLAPALAAFVRKLAPGQPGFLEVAGVGGVLVAGAWLLTQRRAPPQWVTVPLLIWAYFQLLYAVFAFVADWRVGAAATATRIVPMLMAGVAYAAIRNAEDFRGVGKWVGGLAPLLLPVGFVVALFGNDLLPTWLRPIEDLAELGRQYRAGIPAASAVFSTQAVLAMSMLAVFYLCLANVALAEVQRRRVWTWWVLTASAVMMIYFSTRRGALLAALFGLGVYILDRRTVPLKVIVAAMAVVATVLVVDNWGVITGSDFARRSQLVFAFDLSERLIGVFGSLFLFWLLQKPFGTFLGFAGPEAAALGRRFYTQYHGAVEVGGAQLLAEVGLVGAVLMPVVVFVVMWQLFRRARRLRCRRVVNVLLTFQATFFGLYYLKELTAMTGASMAQFFFWAVPGIAAALIVREERERRLGRLLLTRFPVAAGGDSADAP